MRFQPNRRRLLQTLASAGLVMLAGQSFAHHTETHFGDTTAHKVVYQLNKADNEYITHVLFSVGELLRKYGDDIEIIVVVIGPGMHLLAKHPLRPIPEELQQKASSLAAYGVSFHACENTLKSLQWTAKDIADFSKIVPMGGDDLMLLQEQGFSYISW